MADAKAREVRFDFKGFVWRRVAAEGEGDPVKAST
jgi:hypothetical protein